MPQKMRYVVRATRPSQSMTMGWDTQAEQHSCAMLYAKQGWTITLVTYLERAW